MTACALEEFGVREIDPRCAHCVLAAPLQAFADSLPDKDPVQTFGELLQLAADYCASSIEEQRYEDCLEKAPKLLEKLLRDSFAGARGYLRARQ